MSFLALEVQISPWSSSFPALVPPRVLLYLMTILSVVCRHVLHPSDPKAASSGEMLLLLVLSPWAWSVLQVGSILLCLPSFSRESAPPSANTMNTCPVLSFVFFFSFWTAKELLPCIQNCMCPGINYTGPTEDLAERLKVQSPLRDLKYWNLNYVWSLITSANLGAQIEVKFEWTISTPGGRKWDEICVKRVRLAVLRWIGRGISSLWLIGLEGLIRADWWFVVRTRET